jgi:sulfur carrier protein
VAAAVESAGSLRRIVVNGEPREALAVSLAALLDELGYGGQKVATAVNGDFVAERARSATRLASGDRIEIVAPRQGG